jgi:hypothetical protein
VTIMLEAAHILASVSVVLLIGALVAWINQLRPPQFRRLNGGAAANAGNPQIGALLLLAAVGLSAVAAVLAIAGWFAR